MFIFFKVLCIENAFAHPNEVTEFSAGCAVINESFTQWLQVSNFDHFDMEKKSRKKRRAEGNVNESEEYLMILSH